MGSELTSEAATSLQKPQPHHLRADEGETEREAGTASLYQPDIILTTASTPHHYKQRDTETDECAETRL